MFELEKGTKETQETIKKRCIEADPKHGEMWCSTMKDMSNLQKTTAEGLEIVANKIILEKQQLQQRHLK